MAHEFIFKDEAGFNLAKPEEGEETSLPESL